MKLTNRLLTIASMIDTGSTVADIGTDHAYIPVYLVKNNISKKIIACDINKGPIKRATMHIKQNYVQDYIETRLGSGLSILAPNEVDTIIIAGMGGVLITEILSASPQIVNSIKKLILQPMNGEEVVREWLYKNNFKIVDEVLAKEEEKIYQIIAAEHGNAKVEDDIYYEIGEKLFHNKEPLLKELIDKKIKKMNKIIKNIASEDTERALYKKNECENKLNRYLDLLNILNMN